MTQQVRTRFAPSPTGFLHVGNFRTALYAYLFARKNNGQFIIRIEDTDAKRTIPGAEEAIFRVLKWAGINHDEGPDINGSFGPYRQSERLPIYQKYALELINNGHAYYCFCSPKKLDEMRLEQEKNGQTVKYDRRCRNLTNQEIKDKLNRGENYVIRQKINTLGKTTFRDIIRGQITINNDTLDDQILLKSDGYPTYNFANVIDDHLMCITHIIRGEEYITSTPKYIQLYQSFGWNAPEHIHVPLILNKDRSKLSKRQGDVAVEDYIKKGYLPEALTNFIALLGWNPGDERELFNLQELINEFSVNRIHKSGAVFDLEKLDWMNGHYIKQKNLDELADLCRPYLLKYFPIDQKINQDYLKSIINLEQPRIKTLSEIGERVAYFFQTPQYDPAILIWKKSNQEITKKRLEFLINFLRNVPKENWTRATIEEFLLQEIQQNNLNNGDTMWPMRVALSGQIKSPTPFEIAEILGKEETIARLKTAKELLNNKIV